MEKEYFEYESENINNGTHCVKLWTNYNSDSVETILTEAHGILNFFTQTLSNRLYNFVRSKICPILNPYDNTEPDTLIKDFGDIPLFKRFVFDPNISWVDKIHIYVTTSFDDDSFTLCDNDNMKYYIIYDNKTLPPYELHGLHLKYMSIVFSSSLDDVNAYKITNIILHEMKHGYDLIRKRFMANDLNRDIKYFYDTLPEEEMQYITKYYNYSEPRMHKFVISLNSEEIYALIRSMIYLLNTSEMSARLVNFQGDVNMYAITNNKKEFDKSDFYMYVGLSNILRALNLFYFCRNKTKICGRLYVSIQ